MRQPALLPLLLLLLECYLCVGSAVRQSGTGISHAHIPACFAAERCLSRATRGRGSPHPRDLGSRFPCPPPPAGPVLSFRDSSRFCFSSPLPLSLPPSFLFLLFFLLLLLLLLLLVLRFTAFPTVSPASELPAEVSRSPNFFFFSSSGSLAPSDSHAGCGFFPLKPSSAFLCLFLSFALVFVFALRLGQQICTIASPRRNIGPFPARLHAPQFCGVRIFLAMRLVASLVYYSLAYLRMLSELEIIFNFNNINRKYCNEERNESRLHEVDSRIH